MKLFKDILEKTYKYVIYIFLAVVFVSIVCVATGIFCYVFLDKDCDGQFVQGCMAAGMSEQACKDKLYR